jgi:hypothetical protein
MERSDALALISIILIALLGALFVGSATMFSRSETLSNVRDTDVELVEALMREIAIEPPSADAGPRIAEALNVLRNPFTGQPYIGLSVYYADELVASNVPATDQVVRPGDPTIQERVPGSGWRLVVKRYEQGYQWNRWHSFLTVPVAQYRNGRDVNWHSIKEKALTPFVVTLATGLILAGAFATVLIRSRRRIQQLEERVDERMRQLEEAAARLAESEADMEHTREQVSALEDRIREQKSDVEELGRQLDEAGRDRDAEHQQVAKLREQLETSEDLLDELNDEKEVLRRGMVAQENELEGERRAVEARTEEAKRLQAELEAKSKLAASKSEGQKQFLGKVWNVEWHDKALDEAFEIYQTGQPNRRRRLSDLLARSIANLPPRSGGKWEPMKPKAPEVLHNAHKDHAKVYWFQPQSQAVCVLAASGGDDDHERFDGGEALHRRLQTMQAKISKQDK